MERLRRNVGQDIPSTAKTVTWCPECDGINKECQTSIVIGWIDGDEYIAKGIEGMV
jgi:hypothetical protein